MATLDARPFVDWIVDTYEPSVRVGGRPGHYGRVPGRAHHHLYGTSDLACVLSTIGHLDPTEDERAEWAAAFAAFQEPDSGWYREHRPTHDVLHNTAFALAAMRLLRLRPAHPLRFLDDLRRPADVVALLDALDWRDNAYGASHEGAGIAAIAALYPDAVDPGWFDAYFDALDDRFDPRHGLVGEAKPDAGDTDQVGATFHYHFLYEHLRRRMPYPEHRVDTVVGLRGDDGYWRPDNPHYLTLDALYLCTRTVRHQTPERRGQVEDLARSILRRLESDVFPADARRAHFTDWYLGAHGLTAVVSILAECQAFLGADEVLSERPLQLVLDVRPFI